MVMNQQISIGTPGEYFHSLTKNIGSGHLWYSSVCLETVYTLKGTGVANEILCLKKTRTTAIARRSSSQP
jgi:hypothetical protein